MATPRLTAFVPMTVIAPVPAATAVLLVLTVFSVAAGLVRGDDARADADVEGD